MANVLAWLKRAGDKVEVVAVDIVDAGPRLIKAIGDLEKLDPAAKAAIQTLIADGEAVATAVVAAAPGEGTNWVADVNAVAAVEKLVKDFVAMLPTIETDAKTLAADVK